MRRTAQQRWVPAAMTALMVAAATAHAQPPPKPASPAAPATPDPKAVAQAAKHFDAGNLAAELKQWKKAEDEYLKAYALSPLPQILGALGEAELRLGKPRDAAEHLARFLAEDKRAGSDERARATAHLAEAKKEIVTLKITVNEVGAEVLIDDQLIGVSPLPDEVFVTPGKHTVLARKGTARDEVTDTYQKDWTRVMRLKPKEPGAAAQTTTATATAEPTAKPDAKEAGGPRMELVIGGAALAGAALVAGAVFAGLSAGKAGDAAAVRDKLSPGVCVGSAAPPECTELRSRVDEQNVLISGSVWSFVGAGLVGAATISYWFLAPRKPTTGMQPVRAGAMVSGAGGRLVLEGSW